MGILFCFLYLLHFNITTTRAIWLALASWLFPHGVLRRLSWWVSFGYPSPWSGLRRFRAQGSFRYRIYHDYLGTRKPWSIRLAVIFALPHSVVNVLVCYRTWIYSTVLVTLSRLTSTSLSISSTNLDIRHFASSDLSKNRPTKKTLH